LYRPRHIIIQIRRKVMGGRGEMCVDTECSARFIAYIHVERFAI